MEVVAVVGYCSKVQIQVVLEVLVKRVVQVVQEVLEAQVGQAVLVDVAVL